jgi:hypothetical protein
LSSLVAPGFAELLLQLQQYDNGPLVLRVGGSSADQLMAQPIPWVWAWMADLHNRTGIKFIINVPFKCDDSEEVAAAMISRARSALPDGSVLSFELGNEVRQASLQNTDGGRGAEIACCNSCSCSVGKQHARAKVYQQVLRLLHLLLAAIHAAECK